jgi:hypothetical protein
MEIEGQLPLRSAKAIFLYAEAFSQAAEMLQDQFQQLDPEKAVHVTQSAAGVPRTVLDAFATELYLKCLQKNELGKIVQKGHVLKKLFEALPTGTQKAIRYRYNEIVANSPITKVLQNKHPRFAVGLDNVLEMSSDVFFRVRYLYEGEHGKMFYWPLLRTAVRNTIIAIHPDWEVFKAKK